MLVRVTLLMVLCLIHRYKCEAQDCIMLDDIGSYVAKSIRPMNETIDSVNLTIFVKFKIDTMGQINSLWANRPKMIINYDKYISETDVESLKLYYSMYKKLYIIEEKIFRILEDKQLVICRNMSEDLNFVLPILIDFRSDKSAYYFDNNFYALKGLFDGTHDCYNLLPPVMVKKPLKYREPR